MLKVGVLGPVAVWRGREALDVRGVRQRALLAALAVDVGQVVGTDVLLDRVWGDRLPARPQNALQQQVFKLRRLVGEDVVSHEAPGYRLALEPDAVDAVRFEELLDRARSSLESAPQDAAALLEQALALWRGLALADVVYEPWAAGEAARLEERRIQAEELRADALLRAGRADEAVGALKLLVGLQPLRERPRGLLMLALYRDGRQAEALAAYTDAREALVTQLGIEPGAELNALHRLMLRQDPSLDYGVGREGESATDRPLPGPLARQAASSRFVGRGVELGALEAAWSAAAAGELGSVFVSGEPGIGKTRLVAEHARTVAVGGGRVLYARAEQEVDAPYGLFVGALDQLVRALPSEVVKSHVEAHGRELARLVPALAARVPDLPPARAADPDTERLRLHEAVAALLEAAAKREPVLLVLEDVHWADRASLILLTRLLGGPSARVLVLATYRGTQIDQRPPLHELLPRLLLSPESTQLELTGLTEEDVVALMESELGRPLEAPEADIGVRLHRETRGNALFASEMLRHLLASGGLTPDSAPVGVLEVPATVRELVVQRLEQIGSDAAAALLPATVVGQSFDVDLLVHLTETPEGPLLDALDRAREAALIVEAREPGTFSFPHAVIHAALADALGPSRRRFLQRRLAEKLEALEVTDARRLGQLARLWIESGDNERGRHAAVRAGDAALQLLAPDEAMHWYGRALELHGSAASAGEADRADILVRLGEAERRAGSEAFREHLLEAGQLACGLDDADLLGRAALANNRGMHSRTGLLDVERLELLDAALELRPRGDDPQRALLLATTSSELWLGDHDRRLALSDEALAIARHAGDPRVLAEVIYRRAFATSEPATLRERLELTAELVELTDRLGDPLLRLLASVERSRAAIEDAQLEEAVRHSHRQRELAAECGDAYGRHGAGWAQAWPHALAGRLKEAERAAEHALAESLASEQPDALAFYGAQIAAIRWDQGRLGELADGIVAHAEGPEGLPAHRALAALALAEGGRIADASRLIDGALAEGFELPVDTIWLTGMAMWGDACVLCGREDAAPVLLDRLEPWREQVAFTGLAVHGCTARPVAELAALIDREDAGELFACAENVHERLAAPALLARTRVGWARWVSSRGADSQARELHARAREAALECDCPHLPGHASAAT